MKSFKWLPLWLLLATMTAHAQKISGSYYSLTQFYNDDSLMHFKAPESGLRSMQYLDLHLLSADWEAGFNAEYYLPEALLGYNPELKGYFLGWYVQYQKDNWKLRAGNIYDQFGSGMVFRSWNDKQLGIDNALRGIDVQYKWGSGPAVKLIAGQPRTGMTYDDSFIGGISVKNEFELGLDASLNVEASAVTRYYEPENDKVPAHVNLYGIQTQFSGGPWDFYFEYDYKTPDALYANGVLNDRVLFDGDAYTFNAGYARKGFGVNLTLRRAENIQMYSRRSLEFNPYNTGVVNYVPALVKQHDYPLATLYVYATRPGISWADMHVGEIGGQADMVFKIKRKTFLGGRYGTVVSVNASQWHALKAEFIPALGIYKRNFWEGGALYYRDINVEIKRKLNKKLKTGLFVMHQNYNQLLLEGHGEMINALTVVSDWYYRLPHYSSLRFEAEHLWTKQDEKNWAEAGLEFNYNGTWGFFVNDMYNYGSSKIHYYNAGVVYTHGGNRLQLSYGRQKGGLVCVGGVCRYVPPSKGLQLSLSLSLL
ncbi:MAG: hypothetical protein GXO24_06465 [Chlorobi bacterium]|nr:hypothetical protein [Chlorobiota bacterium]